MYKLNFIFIIINDPTQATPQKPPSEPEPLQKFMVSEFFYVHAEVISEVIGDFGQMTKNLIIHQNFSKTSEVTSKSILSNFQTMNFRSNFKSLGGFCSVGDYLRCITWGRKTDNHFSLDGISCQNKFLFQPLIK